MRNLAGFFLIFSTSSAWADVSDVVAAQGPAAYSNIFMLAGFLAIFYFVLIRPQSKRAKEQQALLSNIAKDDEVVTNGGLLGKVLRVSDQFLVIGLAEGIEVKIQKQAIVSALPKGTIKGI